MEEEAPNGTDIDGEDSELDSDWVDFENELASDDDDSFNEWVDENFEEKRRRNQTRSRTVVYADLEELEDSYLEAADEVVVINKQGRKKTKKEVKVKRWSRENMKELQFHICRSWNAYLDLLSIVILLIYMSIMTIYCKHS